MIDYSKSLDDLHPAFRPLALRVVGTLRDAGLDPVVVMTWRSPKKQAELYAIGRRRLAGGLWLTVGRTVTNAPPGRSPHECGLALDVAPRAVLSEKDWNPASPLWVEVGRIARAQGALWGGDWRPSRRDRPHVEHPGWKRIAKAEPWTPLALRT